MPNILPTITTASTEEEWKSKLKEIDKLKIKQACVFLTGLKQDQRKIFYNLLAKTKLESAPLVHLRSDMEEWEIDYFIKKYKTRVFNTHSAKDYPISQTWQKFFKRIYIENSTNSAWDEKELKQFAGICVDFTHLENSRRLNPLVFKKNIKIIEKYPCACAHISAIKNAPYPSAKTSRLRYHSHRVEHISEVDYLKNYPLKYFPKIIALEFKNSLKEQLEIRDYILKFL